ncbi:Hypothetical_protein [Hexamita inflata]|uniref:Hypothetical_protein n=1 Tax=Hexamita inflata TaxID=28002 RepID=A0AA86R5Y9_9EUKA|nr:Hypothetical protein HINF_LOCUS55451 [Hexamita inflata]
MIWNMTLNMFVKPSFNQQPEIEKIEDYKQSSEVDSSKFTIAYFGAPVALSITILTAVLKNYSYQYLEKKQIEGYLIEFQYVVIFIALISKIFVQNLQLNLSKVLQLTLIGIFIQLGDAPQIFGYLINGSRSKMAYIVIATIPQVMIHTIIRVIK